MDNDLLTWWLAAGSLDRDAVRDLIQEVQDAREDVAHDENDKITAYESTVEELNEEIEDLTKEIADLRGEVENAELGRSLADDEVTALKAALRDEREKATALEAVLRVATAPPV